MQGKLALENTHTHHDYAGGEFHGNYLRNYCFLLLLLFFEKRDRGIVIIN